MQANIVYIIIDMSIYREFTLYKYSIYIYIYIYIYPIGYNEKV